MDIKQFENHLDSLQNTLEPSEVLNAIFDLLEKNPSGEEKELLEIWMMTYSTEDVERVTLYWKVQLEQGSSVRRNKAITFLGVLSKRNSLAKNVLRDYINANQSDDPMWQELRNRFIDDSR